MAVADLPSNRRRNSAACEKCKSGDDHVYVLLQVSLVGDLVTLCAAVAVIGYFEVGQRLRAWMPIFLYACPATGASLLTPGRVCAYTQTVMPLDEHGTAMLSTDLQCAAVDAGIAAFLLTIGAIALEGARFGKLGIGGVFGWLSRDYLLGIGCVATTPVCTLATSHTCCPWMPVDGLNCAVQLFGSCAGDCWSHWSEHGFEIHLAAFDNSVHHNRALDWGMYWCARPPDGSSFRDNSTT